MINKDFLSKLTILYVEDEELAREKLAKTLKKLFKKVILAPNGKEGLRLFQECLGNNEHIDLVLSDINMPLMNGIEMLEHIREVDTEVPFIYTTARSESEHLLRAIELHVNHYILKPINTQDLIMRIQVACEKKYYQSMLQRKQEELERYLDAIDHVAIVFKMREDGSITFANKSFLETSKYSQEEIKKLNFESFIHPDIPKQFIAGAWEALKMGKVWQGNTKFIDRNREVFYINSTIFKIDNDEKDEYITIGFLTTKENIQKREFHKKVIQNIQEFNKKESSYKKLILELNHKVKENASSIPALTAQIEEEKEKSLNKERQLNHYEMQMHKVEEKYQVVMNNKNKEVDEHIKRVQTLKQEKDTIASKVKDMEEDIEAKRNEIELLTASNERKSKRIKDLKELVEVMEEEQK